MYNLTVSTAHTFFVGDGQWLVHNACPKGYRERFFEKFPDAPDTPNIQIHHRIPQKARDLGIYTAKEVDDVSNLRAVPKRIHEEVSTEWGDFGTIIQDQPEEKWKGSPNGWIGGMEDISGNLNKF